MNESKLAEINGMAEEAKRLANGFMKATAKCVLTTTDENIDAVAAAEKAMIAAIDALRDAAIAGVTDHAVHPAVPDAGVARNSDEITHWMPLPDAPTGRTHEGAVQAAGASKSDVKDLNPVHLIAQCRGWTLTYRDGEWLVDGESGFRRLARGTVLLESRRGVDPLVDQALAQLDMAFVALSTADPAEPGQQGPVQAGGTPDAPSS
jgi:hypothetical protein